MSTAKFLGKLFVKATGRQVTHQATTVASRSLQEIVQGQPRAVKKKFYRAVSLFLRNPENKAAEQVIREAAENSTVVRQQLNRECEQAVEKARKMAEKAAEASAKERKVAEETFSQATSENGLYNDYITDFKEVYEQTAREAFGYTYEARKKLAALPIEQGIIPPVQMRHALQKARTEAMTNLRNLDIPIPSVKLTEAETDRIVNEVIRETIHESATLTSRTITYPFNKFASLFLPKNIKEICKDIMHLPKDKFGKEFYSRLLKSKGLTDRAPSEIVVTAEEGIRIPTLFSKKGKLSCTGGYNSFENTISFSKEFTKLSRSAQANLLSHELRHFEQTYAIIRTYGIDKYIEALKLRCLKTAKGNILNCGKTDQEIMAAVEEQFKKLEPQIRKNFEKSIQATKIKPASKEGKQAKKYIKSLSSYEAYDPTRPISLLKYLTNGLETDAYKTGYKNKFFTSVLERLNLRAA